MNGRRVEYRRSEQLHISQRPARTVGVDSFSPMPNTPIVANLPPKPKPQPQPTNPNPQPASTSVINNIPKPKPQNHKFSQPAAKPQPKPIHQAPKPTSGNLRRSKLRAAQAHQAAVRQKQLNRRRNMKLARSARVLIAMEKVANRQKTAGKSNRRFKLMEKVRQKGRKLRHVSKRRLAAQLCAVVLVGLATYTLIDTWRLNNQVKQATVAAQTSDDAQARQEVEGKDESTVSGDAVDNYKVASELPRVIKIDKIGVRARVMQMGVNPDGSMQAPVNVFDAGWYTGSVRPGQKGAAAIVAHAYGPTLEGLFYRLKNLEKGDLVTIELGDGQFLRYQVVAKETTPLDKIDMDKFMNPADGVSEGLNMMTCTGKWVPASKTYDHREIVYTKRIE